MTSVNLLHARDLTLLTPGGRPLFRDLTLLLDRGDRAALVGRNGVGKSSLLHVLAGEAEADRGQVTCHGERILVPQSLETPLDTGESPGELRRRWLQDAIDAEPDLLLLDEPTHDLDQAGLEWLSTALGGFRRALLLVSHDRRLLRDFHDFFVVSETGCHHFGGSFDALLEALGREQEQQERRHVSQLRRLDAREEHGYLVQQRARRQKNVGRIRELKRRPARALLNSKRSYAQESQTRRALIQQDRIAAARGWAQATRRALAVDLPLEPALPRLPPASSHPLVRLQHVSASVGERCLFAGVSLELERQRLAVTGPNGSGKSTLLELMAGVRAPQRGLVSSDVGRIGYVAQNSVNWRLDESVLSQLVGHAHVSAEQAAQAIRSHKFPFALAERPLSSLSPGERLRAALICLFQRSEPPELLILDEPTSHLDLLGYGALQALLASWPGGLIVASHDREFLDAIQLHERLDLTPEVELARGAI
jgi:ATPase subunit of ABC transporter with duplicated ATPase domains